MKKYNIFLIGLVLFVFGFFQVAAEIVDSGEEKIIFSADKLQKDVTWSKGFSLKATGLETEQLPEGQSQDIWIQTHAFPIGLSWRPPTAASFYVSFDGGL